MRLHNKIGIVTGLLLVAIGCLLMATSHADSGWTVLLPGFVVAGVGIGHAVWPSQSTAASARAVPTAASIALPPASRMATPASAALRA